MKIHGAVYGGKNNFTNKDLEEVLLVKKRFECKVCQATFKHEQTMLDHCENDHPSNGLENESNYPWID